MITRSHTKTIQQLKDLLHSYLHDKDDLYKHKKQDAMNIMFVKFNLRPACTLSAIDQARWYKNWCDRSQNDQHYLLEIHEICQKLHLYFNMNECIISNKPLPSVSLLSDRYPRYSSQELGNILGYKCANHIYFLDLSRDRMFVELYETLDHSQLFCECADLSQITKEELLVYYEPWSLKATELLKHFDPSYEVKCILTYKPAL